MIPTIEGGLRFSKRLHLLMEGVIRAASLGLVSVIDQTLLGAALPDLAEHMKKPLAFSLLPNILTGSAIRKPSADESTVRALASQLLTIDNKTS